MVQDQQTIRTVETLPDAEVIGGAAFSRRSRQGPAIDCSPAVSIQLLGGFRLAVGSRVIEESEWPLRKTKSLIKLLALAPDRRMHRGKLMDLLWPDLELEAAANNLHKALHLLRRVLEPNLQPKVPSSYVHLQSDFVVLRPPGALYIDVEAFQEAATVALSAQAHAFHEEALRLYGGDLLPEDRYEDWVTRRRESLHTTRLDLLFGLARLHEHGGNVGAAIDVLRQVVVIEPAHEDAHAGLMRLLAQSGRRHLALRQYQQLCDAMRRELDGEPDPSTQALHRQILRGQGPTPLPPTDRHIGRSVEAPLIGRKRELAYLGEHIDALCQGHGGLVLVRGEAGIGKSRLLAELIDRANQIRVPFLWNAPEKDVEPGSEFSFDRILESCVAWLDSLEQHAHVNSTALDSVIVSPAIPPFCGPRGQASAEGPVERRQLAITADFVVDPDVRGPLLIVLDDLQLASDFRLDLLRHLAEKAHHGPILFVGAFRPERVSSESSLTHLITKLEREAPGRILDVNRLDFLHTEILVPQLLGGPVDRSVVETVYGLADGNLYYTQEATEALRGRGQIWCSGGMWRLQSGSVMVWGREYLRQPESRSGAQRGISHVRAS
jgi:DNA-binding SARP family transcriptional activator